MTKSANNSIALNTISGVEVNYDGTLPSVKIYNGQVTTEFSRGIETEVIIKNEAPKEIVELIWGTIENEGNRTWNKMENFLKPIVLKHVKEGKEEFTNFDVMHGDILTALLGKDSMPNKEEQTVVTSANTIAQSTNKEEKTMTKNANVEGINAMTNEAAKVADKRQFLLTNFGYVEGVNGNAVNLQGLYAKTAPTVEKVFNAIEDESGLGGYMKALDMIGNTTTFLKGAGADMFRRAKHSGLTLAPLSLSRTDLLDDIFDAEVESFEAADKSKLAGLDSKKVRIGKKARNGKTVLTNYMRDLLKELRAAHPANDIRFSGTTDNIVFTVDGKRRAVRVANLNVMKAEVAGHTVRVLVQNKSEEVVNIISGSATIVSDTIKSDAFVNASVVEMSAWVNAGLVKFFDTPELLKHIIKTEINKSITTKVDPRKNILPLNAYAGDDANPLVFAGKVSELKEHGRSTITKKIAPSMVVTESALTSGTTSVEYAGNSLIQTPSSAKGVNRHVNLLQKVLITNEEKLTAMAFVSPWHAHKITRTANKDAKFSNNKNILTTIVNGNTIERSEKLVTVVFSGAVGYEISEGISADLSLDGYMMSEAGVQNFETLENKRHYEDMTWKRLAKKAYKEFLGLAKGEKMTDDQKRAFGTWERTNLRNIKLEVAGLKGKSVVSSELPSQFTAQSEEAKIAKALTNGQYVISYKADKKEWQGASFMSQQLINKAQGKELKELTAQTSHTVEFGATEVLPAINSDLTNLEGMFEVEINGNKHAAMLAPLSVFVEKNNANEKGKKAIASFNGGIQALLSAFAVSPAVANYLMRDAVEIKEIINRLGYDVTFGTIEQLNCDDTNGLTIARPEFQEIVAGMDADTIEMIENQISKYNDIVEEYNLVEVTSENKADIVMNDTSFVTKKYSIFTEGGFSGQANIFKLEEATDEMIDNPGDLQLVPMIKSNASFFTEEPKGKFMSFEDWNSIKKNVITMAGLNISLEDSEASRINLSLLTPETLANVRTALDELATVESIEVQPGMYFNYEASSKVIKDFLPVELNAAVRVGDFLSNFSDQEVDFRNQVVAKLNEGTTVIELKDFIMDIAGPKWNSLEDGAEATEMDKDKFNVLFEAVRSIDSYKTDAVQRMFSKKAKNIYMKQLDALYMNLFTADVESGKVVVNSAHKKFFVEANKNNMDFMTVRFPLTGILGLGVKFEDIIFRSDVALNTVFISPMDAEIMMADIDGDMMMIVPVPAKVAKDLNTAKPKNLADYKVVRDAQYDSEICREELTVDFTADAYMAFTKAQRSAISVNFNCTGMFVDFMSKIGSMATLCLNKNELAMFQQELVKQFCQVSIGAKNVADKFGGKAVDTSEYLLELLQDLKIGEVENISKMFDLLG